MTGAGLRYSLDRGYFAYEGEKWWLYSLGEAPDDSEANKQLTHVRELDIQEVADVGRLAEVSRVIDVDCAFEKFCKETDRLSEAMSGVLEAPSTQAVLEAGDEIHRQFGIWLSAFRACDDHTSHQLSESFGRSSSELRSFKEQTSAEYDANFAYRLSWSLRNASQHAGNVLNDLRVDFATDGDRQGSLRVLVAEMDGPRTAENFPKMSANLREELMSCSAALQVLPFARAVRQSVHRLRSATQAMITEGHEDLIQQCWSLQEEAWAVEGGRWAVFVDQPPEHVATTRFRLRYNPYQQADVLTRYYERCKGIADAPPILIDAEDLVRASDERSLSLPI